MATTTAVPRDSRADANGFFHGMNDKEFAKHLDAWCAGKLWHDEAPKDLRKNWTALDTDTAWKRWTQYIAKRKPVSRPADASTKTDPLDWGMPAGKSALADAGRWRTDFDRQLRKATTPAAATQIEALLAELVHGLENNPPTAAIAYQAVAVAYRLAELAGCLTSSAWWRVVLALKHAADEAQKVSLDPLKAEPMLVAVLMGGELPLVLSVVLSELAPLRNLRAEARKSLGESLLAATDGEGLVDSVLLPVLPALFSSWTRARAIGEYLKKGCWSSSAETQFEWLVRQTLRLQRPDGTPMLSTEHITAWPGGVLDTALSLAGDEHDSAAALAHLPKSLLAIRGDFDEYELPEASVESEWSTLALLANGWGKSASRVLVDYSKRTLRLEVESEGRTLFSGDWGTETWYAGKQLEPIEDWEQQCWYSDDDLEYFDLMLELSGGARLERQIFLGKEDGFLMTHDILHGPGSPAGEWRHTMQLPFAGGNKFAAEKETRDGILVDSKGAPRATVLPLALAEWRTDPRGGELTMNDGKLQLVQTSRGERMSCPVWFDLRPRRTAKPRTWRRLTIAESLKVAPSDKAVGYRVQVGDLQWLVYRSLSAPANRTVLGQNTAAEMFIGRFYRTGEFDELLAVDPD
jgi:hypothetical protein